MGSGGIYRSFLKRPLDVILSVLGLIFLAPIMLLLWIIIRWRLGTPVLFSQQRPGLHGKLFTLYKFRTMNDSRGEKGDLLPDAQRLTRLGSFLRKTSLDELPELVNVVRGDMSLVGPRPLLMQYLPRYTREQARRHEVRPGITGWAQVNGRNAITWERKFDLDVWYVDHISFLVDLKILLKTFGKVLIREGVEFGLPDEMPYFTGTVGDEGKSAEKIQGVDGTSVETYS